jgi:hypothetical protein
MELAEPGFIHAELWIQELIRDLPFREDRPHASPWPADWPERSCKLADPDHRKAFRGIMELIPDLFAGPLGEAYSLYDWAQYTLGIRETSWNFGAKIPADFSIRFHHALYSEGGEVLPEAESIEARRRHLIEAGLLVTENCPGRPNPALAPEPPAEGGGAPTVTSSSSPIQAMNREQKNEKIRECLRKKPGSTSKEIAAALCIADQTVRNMSAWKSRPRDQAHIRKPGRYRERALSDEMLAILPSDRVGDPADIVADEDDYAVWRNRYLDTLNERQRGEFFGLSPRHQCERVTNYWLDQSS